MSGYKRRKNAQFLRQVHGSTDNERGRAERDEDVFGSRSARASATGRVQSHRTAPCARLCGSETRRGSTEGPDGSVAEQPNGTTFRASGLKKIVAERNDTNERRLAKRKTFTTYDSRTAASSPSRPGFTVPGWRRACRSTGPESSAGSALKARVGRCAAGTTPGPAPRRWSAPRSLGR